MYIIAINTKIHYNSYRYSKIDKISKYYGYFSLEKSNEIIRKMTGKYTVLSSEHRGSSIDLQESPVPFSADHTQARSSEDSQEFHHHYHHDKSHPLATSLCAEQSL